MGPVFYLVQCDGGLPAISAVLVGNWPHEFALAPCPGKGGCALDRRLCLQRQDMPAARRHARKKLLRSSSCAAAPWIRSGPSDDVSL